MFKRGLVLTMSLLLIAFAFNSPADAQIEEVTLHLDAFLCNNECTNKIQSVMSVYEDELEDLAIDHQKSQVTLFPNPEKRLDLYDIRRELRNAGYTPWKTDITVTGTVVDHAKVYSGGHVHPRKALKVVETDQQFILIEGEQLDALLDFLKAGEHEKVTIEGFIPSFDEKFLPVLLIQEFREAGKERTASVSLAVEGFH